MIQAINTSVKGRVRYKIKELYQSYSLKEYLERSLSNMSEIISVEANPLTSNILVLFQANLHYKNIGFFIQEILLDYKKNIKEFPADKLATHKKNKGQLINAQAQKIENWHLMEVPEVLDAFQSSKASGLSTELARENLNKYGLNVLGETATRSDLSILIEQFQSLPVALLGVAAGISVFTGGIVDAVVILGVIGLNAAIGYVTESQSERIINSLRSREESSTWVIRDSGQLEIPTENVVLGDILVLKPGNYVAADARLIEADNLSIDESALTGESIPITKNTASSNV